MVGVRAVPYCPCRNVLSGTLKPRAPVAQTVTKPPIFPPSLPPTRTASLVVPLLLCVTTSTPVGVCPALCMAGEAWRPASEAPDSGTVVAPPRPGLGPVDHGPQWCARPTAVSQAHNLFDVAQS